MSFVPYLYVVFILVGVGNFQYQFVSNFCKLDECFRKGYFYFVARVRYAVIHYSLNLLIVYYLHLCC